jgi:hypothetical protein
MFRTSRIRVLLAMLIVGLAGPIGTAQQSKPVPFRQAKTCFQTNSAFDPRLGLAVDAVIVHRHGDPPDNLRNVIGSWKAQGFTVGRMFFSDSDATNVYWTGKWDGVPHPQEVERNEKGELIQCSGIRPYMLPTEGWIRHLEQMAMESIEAGADAVLPEEPLAHVISGYEEAFKELWVQRYGRPWEGENSSPEARYLTAQLKSELYAKLEQRLADAVQRRSSQLGRDVPFVLPIHSIYSNVASHLVAPLGDSLSMRNVDGYIGQIWTGPVNWAQANYDDPGKTFYASAYVLYDYFVELARDSGRKLWLLVDPVEDNPNHTWAEFEDWYQHCLVAQLMFPEVDSYEVMPWPDRIFLPGHQTGGSTPAPERFRILALAATQVLQDVPLGGTWQPFASKPLSSVPKSVGIVVADTLMAEKEPPLLLQAAYGMTMPLVRRGLTPSACLLERVSDGKYMARFKTLVLSYEGFKPAEPAMNRDLAKWVKAGGRLVVLGAAEELKGDSLWWNRQKFASPLHHLFAELGIAAVDQEGEQAVGKGKVVRRLLSPRKLGDAKVVEKEYLPLVLDAADLKLSESMCIRRGPFVAAHSFGGELKLPGDFVNVFEPQLPVVHDPVLGPGQSGLYVEVTRGLAKAGGKPCVLFTTHRLMSSGFKGGKLSMTLRGPAETPAVARLFIGNRRVEKVTAHDATGRMVEAQVEAEDSTARVQVPNHPAGVTVEVSLR